MNWKFIFYDWYGLNAELFEAINAGMPVTLGPLVWFLSLVSNYWTAPLMLLGLWGWSRFALLPAQANAVWYRFIIFSTAILLALLATSVLKLWLDFPRPTAVFGELVSIAGEHEKNYSFPSEHATYSALVVGTLWTLVGYRGQISLVLYAVLAGWACIAAGISFPADILAGWCIGLGCIVIARTLIAFIAPVLQTTLHASSLIWYGVTFFAFITDQLTKFVIVRIYSYGEQVEVTPFFNLVHVLNPGAAFSFLAGAGGWQRYFFITFGLAFSAWLAYMLKKQLSRPEALGYSLMLGGALGNIADRILRGSVVDLLDVHWQDIHWPAFNLADVFVAAGVTCLIISSLYQTRLARTEKKSDGVIP